MDFLPGKLEYDCLAELTDFLVGIPRLPREDGFVAMAGLSSLTEDVEDVLGRSSTQVFQACDCLNGLEVDEASDERDVLDPKVDRLSKLLASLSLVSAWLSCVVRRLFSVLTVTSSLRVISVSLLDVNSSILAFEDFSSELTASFSSLYRLITSFAALYFCLTMLISSSEAASILETFSIIVFTFFFDSSYLSRAMFLSCSNCLILVSRLSFFSIHMFLRSSIFFAFFSMTPLTISWCFFSYLSF